MPLSRVWNEEAKGRPRRAHEIMPKPKGQKKDEAPSGKLVRDDMSYDYAGPEGVTATEWVNEKTLKGR